MVKILVLMMVMALTLAGCSTPSFAVKEVDNRFSDSNVRTFVGENNRISTKSIAGGSHIDSSGVYIDPFARTDSTTGKLLVLGFNVVNRTSYDTVFGSPNSFGVIEKMVFRFTNGELISLPMSDQDTRSSDTISYNSLLGSAGYGLWEGASTIISRSDYERIADADSIAVQIIGSKRSMVYEVKDIAPAFLANLRQFRNSYIRQ